MNKSTILKIFFIGCMIFLSSPIFSEDTTPLLVNLQATFASSKGLINGPHTVVVQIKNNSETVWEQAFQNEPFINGTVSLVLGSGVDPLLPEHFDGEAPYFRIQVKLSDSTVRVAALPIYSIPYAIQAKTAKTVKEARAESIVGTFKNPVVIQNDLTVKDNAFKVDSTQKRVGIGTSTPSTDLDVKGTVNASTYYLNGAPLEDSLPWTIKKDNSMYYTKGKVGIGTSIPQFALDVSGTVNVTNLYIDREPVESKLAKVLAWKPSTTSGNIYFNDGTQAGRVGIGVNTPLETLHVNGGILIEESVQTGTPKLGTIQYKDGDFQGFTSAGWTSLTGIKVDSSIISGEIPFWIGSSTLGGSLNFIWNNSSKFLGIGTSDPKSRVEIKGSTGQTFPYLKVVDNSDNPLLVVATENVGVGKSAPAYKLDIDGTVNATSYMINGKPLQSQLLSGTFWRLENEEKIYYDLGNVGIGTSNPEGLLEIAATTSHNPTLTFDIAGNNLFTLGIDYTNPDAFIFSKGGDLTTPVFVFKNDRIGVGITTPEANLHVSGNTGLIVEGHINDSTELPADGKGTRLMWFPARSAFRVGTVVGSEWNDENLGLYSSAMGYSTIASGEGSAVAGGIENKAIGDYSAVPGGFGNIAQGDYSFAAGYKAFARHRGSFVWSDYVPSINSFTSGFGNQFIVRAHSGVGIGTSDTIGSTLTLQQTDREQLIFRAIGTDTSSETTEVVVINTSGNVGIGTTNPGSAKLAVMGGNIGIGTITPNAGLTIVNKTPGAVLLSVTGADSTPTPAVFVVTASGNVGIGKTNPQGKLDVDGAIIGSSFQIIDPNNPDATIILQNNPGSPWADPSKAQGNTFRVEGYIGIGTPSPNSLLEISNRSGKDPIITFDIDGTDRFSMGVTKNTFVIQPGSRLTQATPSIVIATTNTGFGTYTPQATVHVAGNAIVSGNMAIGTSNVSSVYKLNVAGKSSFEEIYLNNIKFVPSETPWKNNLSGSIYYTSGNVGIGTSAPSEKLEVVGTVSANQIIVNSDFIDISKSLASQTLLLKNGTDATYGELFVEDGELFYIGPGQSKKEISSPIQKGNGVSGPLGFWVEDGKSIGKSSIIWDNTDSRMDISGNFTVSNTQANNQFIISSNMSLGSPSMINIISDVNPSDLIEDNQSYTAQSIQINIQDDWGINSSSSPIKVKGLDIKLSQNENNRFLSGATAIGLNVDVSSVNITGTAKKAAAVFLGGNVGINVDNPVTDLEVRGTVSANFFNLSNELTLPALYVGQSQFSAFIDSQSNPRVGIGIRTPNTEFEVVGTTSLNALITGELTATTLNIGNGNFFINENGNIGIGTTTPDTLGQIEFKKEFTESTSGAFTSQKMTININGGKSSNNPFYFDNDITGLDIVIKSDDPNSNLLQDNRVASGVKIDMSNLKTQSLAKVVGLDVNVAGSNTRYAAIFNGGYVGIGTSQPQASLHVIGDIIADNLYLEGQIQSETATFDQLIVEDRLTVNGTLIVDQIDVDGKITANTLAILNSISAPSGQFDSLIANTVSINGVLKVASADIKTSITGTSGIFTQSLGIGTSTAPTTGLEVSGSITATSMAISNLLELNTATLNVNDSTLYISGNSPYVGIGTRTPTAPLHIVQTSGTYDANVNTSWKGIRIQNLGNSLDTAAGIVLIPDPQTPSATIGSGIVAVRKGVENARPGSDLIFITDPILSNPAERMRITSEGFIGIGTSTPAKALDIVGNAKINGDLIVASALEVSQIQSTSSITFSPTTEVIFESTANFKGKVTIEKPLVFQGTTPPTAIANYGQLYVDDSNQDLYFMNSTGTSTNITKAFTGEKNKIPYFDANGSLSDDTALYWINNEFRIGATDNFTTVALNTAISNETTGKLSAETISLGFTDRSSFPAINVGDVSFTGLNITFQGQTATDESGDTFGRLGNNEIAVGLNVDVSNLEARSFTHNLSNSTLQGYKYAALFLGGNVGIGTTLPDAQLHIKNESTQNAALVIDTKDSTGTVVQNAFVVDKSGKVGFGTGTPTAQVTIVSKGNTSSTKALQVFNSDGDILFNINDDGKIGFGTANPSTTLEVVGTISGNVGQFDTIEGNAISITKADGTSTFYVSNTGQIGFGTTAPESPVQISQIVNASTNSPVIGQKININLNKTGANSSNPFFLEQNLQGLQIALASNASNKLQAGYSATGIDVDLSNLLFSTGSTAIGISVDVSNNAQTRYAALFNGGYVGIGTTRPSTELEVMGTISANNLIVTNEFSGNAVTINSITVQDSATFASEVTITTLHATTVSANNVLFNGNFLATEGSFVTLNTQIASFNTLAVNVSTPTYTFEVSGNSLFAGNVSVNGTLYPTEIRSADTLTINATNKIAFVGNVASDTGFALNGGLIFSGIATPNSASNLGQLYVNQVDGDLYYRYNADNPINISQAFSGQENRVPFFNASRSLSDQANLAWLPSTNTFKVGSENVLTTFEIIATINKTASYTTVSGEKIELNFENRTNASNAIFKGLDISLTGANTNQADTARLGENEIAVGLKVDVSGLKAEQSDEDGNPQFGYKYAAQFLGGSVGIGVTPDAMLHVKSEASLPAVLRVDSLVSGSTITSIIVSKNGTVGMGTTLPTALLHLKGISSTTPIFNVEDINNNTSMYVNAAGDVGFGTTLPTSKLHLYGSSPLRIGSESHPYALIVTNNSKIGIGTSLPEYSLHVKGTNPFRIDSTVSSNIIVVDTNKVGIGKSNPAFSIDSNGIIGSSDGASITLPSWARYDNTRGFFSNYGNNIAFFGLLNQDGKTATRNIYDTVIVFGDQSNTVPQNFKILYQNASTQNEILRIKPNGLIGINLPAYSSGGNIIDPIDAVFALKQSVPTQQILNILDANGNSLMAINASGNIGIGTTIPSADFHINGSAIVKTLTVQEGDVRLSTVNISQKLIVADTVSENTESFYSAIVSLNIASDLVQNATGMKINMSSSAREDQPNTGYSIYDGAKAVGLDIDLTDIEIRSPFTPDGSRNGKRYTGIFQGGTVGIGTSNPDSDVALHVDSSFLGRETGGNIARFGTFEGDITVKDYRNGRLGFVLRDQNDAKATEYPVMTFSRNQVGINTVTGNSTEQLIVNGDTRIGIVRNPVSVSNGPEPAGWGNKLYFSGAPDVSTTEDNENGDPMFIGRYNKGSDESELRVNIGSDDGNDKFIVGFEVSSAFRPILTVGNNGRTAIYDGRKDIDSITEPRAELHIIGQSSGVGTKLENHLMVIENIGTNGSDSLAIINSADDYVPNENSNFITFARGKADTLTVLGEIDGFQEPGSGLEGIRYKTNGADYAEYLPKQNAKEKFEAGDILGVRDGKISRKTNGAHHVMVKSTNAGVAGNWPGEDKTDAYELVAFLGQVNVKVIGPVKAGDLIVSSGRNDGTGIAVSPENLLATQYNQVVGTAWESNPNTELKLVKTAVGFNFSAPPVQESITKLQALEKEVQSLKSERQSIENQFNEALEKQNIELQKLTAELKKLSTPKK